MPWQLIYTSAARGLTPGQSGYCTVARSRDLREALIPRLEKLSYYTPEGAASPTICAHRVLELRGVHYHVLTRIVDAGHDFTKRRKFLAHHLIFEPQELRDFSNPAELFQNWRGWREDWTADPEWIEGFTPLSSEHQTPSAWERLTGSAENARALIQNTGWISGDEQECKLFLPAIAESLHGHDKAWDVSFTNCFQPGDDPADFRVCAVWPGTAGFEKSLQLGATAVRLRELRARAVSETAAPVSPPLPKPAPAPERSEPKTNFLWPAMAGVVAVAALFAAIYFRKHEESVVLAPVAPPIPSEEPKKTSPDLTAQLDAVFPVKPTWVVAGRFRELGNAPELQRTFRMLRDAELFGKDLRATLQGQPAAIDARPQENILAVSKNGLSIRLQANESGVTFISNAPEVVVLELNSKERFLFVPEEAPLAISNSFLNVDTNAQKAGLDPMLEARLRSFILPNAVHWSLRPRNDFQPDLENDFGLAPSMDFDFNAIHSQVKGVLHEKEKRAATLRKELETLRAEAKQQITDSVDPAHKERLATLRLAEPRWESELKGWREKAASLPKEFSTFRDYSLFISDGSNRAEVIRFTGEAP